MNIDEQIEALMRVKEKIELFKNLISHVEDVRIVEKKLDIASHPGLADEFADEVVQFCQSKIEELNEGDGKAVTSRGKKPPRPIVDSNQTNNVISPRTPPEEADPLKFLLKHKHLDGKTVRFMSNGSEIQGRVRGLVVPNITVETDLGYIVQVKPSECKVI